MFIVELREGCTWLSKCDFGQTTIKESAKKFKTEFDAQKAIDSFKNGNEYRGFDYKIINLKSKLKR